MSWWQTWRPVELVKRLPNGGGSEVAEDNSQDQAVHAVNEDPIYAAAKAAEDGTDGEAIEAAELIYVAARRRRLELDPPFLEPPPMGSAPAGNGAVPPNGADAPNGAPPPSGNQHFVDVQKDRRIGLALSGGGIRSATFSLGILRGLSRLKLIHKFDYLSTVSGGSYVGAFYTSLFTHPRERGGASKSWSSPTAADDPLGTTFGSAAIRQLRESGRYLMPGGAGDALRIAVMAFRNWVAVQLVIGLSLLALFLCGKTAQVALVACSRIQAFERYLAEEGWPMWLWPIEWLQGYPFRLAILSSLWPFAMACLGFAVALNWAYWLARLEGIQKSRLWRTLGSAATIGTAIIVVVCVGLDQWTGGSGRSLVVAVLGAGALLFYIAAEFCDYILTKASGAGAMAVAREQEDRVRNRITGWATFAVKWALIIGFFAVVDTIGQSVYTLLQQSRTTLAAPLSVAAILAAATPVLQRTLAVIQRFGSAPVLLRRFGRWIALLVGSLLALTILSLWAIVADYIAWRGDPIGTVGEPIIQASPVMSLIVTTAFFASITGCIGLSFGFLNLSSFIGFYAGRLRRAYLGASNPHRVDGRKPSDQDDPGDDITPVHYYRPGSGAPLHLINVTIAETRGEGSALVQRDRKGRPMTLSPAGYLVPTVGEERVRIRFGNTHQKTAVKSPSAATDLPMSTWIAISGAAFSTAIGSYTSTGFSLLAGLANLRLGYWWKPFRENGALRPTQWIQRYLLREFLARFGGIFHHRWYLTDGGHFENTGVYELVRRRVPLIVACDNGADPDYDFGDIVNLTRKLRIDFEAELDFMPCAELDKLLGRSTPTRMLFGELGDLVRFHKGSSSRGPYAALARITAPARPGKDAYLGTMILIKPRLGGLELADLLDYNRVDATFPQQTTGDQFFDEAQWESYYRLGIMIAELIFSPPANRQRWTPSGLAPVDVTTAPWFGEEWVRQPRRDYCVGNATYPSQAQPAKRWTSIELYRRFRRSKTLISRQV